MFLACFDYGRVMCWGHMDVGYFDNNHVVSGGMKYVLGFMVGYLTCIGLGFSDCGR